MDKELNKYVIPDLTNIIMSYTKSKCHMCKIEVDGFGNCDLCEFKVWRADQYVELRFEQDKLKSGRKHIRRTNKRKKYLAELDEYTKHPEWLHMLDDMPIIKHFYLLKYETDRHLVKEKNINLREYILTEICDKKLRLQEQLDLQTRDYLLSRQKEYYLNKQKTQEMFKKWKK